MASKYWIKLYHEIIDDPKMGRMPDRLWRRTVEMFLLAGELDQDGLLPEVRDMAWRLRMPDEDLIDDLSLLATYKIVHKQGEQFVVTKFAERQSPISDAERMKRLRDRKQKEQYYSDDPVTNTVTYRNADTDTDTDTDTELHVKPTGDLFDDCQAIYETKKGYLITDGASFALMIKNFEANGVTAEDYAAAIDAMSANPKYARANKPTSYEAWAIGIADKRRNPVKISKRDSVEVDNQAFIMDMIQKGEI